MKIEKGKKERELIISQSLIRTKQDEFLDAYLRYSRAADAISKKILERKILDLSIVDPNFTFFID